MSFFDRYIKIKPVPGTADRTYEELDVPKVITHVASLLSIVAILAWVSPLYSVPTGSRCVITVGGAITEIRGEGYAVLAPWQKPNLFSIRAEEANVSGAEGATSDTQPVHVGMTVRYSISPDKVAEVFEKYSHDGNLASYVQTATQEAFKSVTAKFTAPQLIDQRSAVSADIKATLSSKLAVFGAQVISIDMTKFAFSDSYMAAINDKVTQEQKRLAAENKLKTVESEQKQKVAVAEAEASAARATADGEAYAQLKVATAQADSLRIQNEALAKNKDVLELRRIEVESAKWSRWNGQLVANQFYGSAPVQVQHLAQ